MSNTNTTAPRKPTYSAFSVRSYKQNGQNKSYRTKIGAAWEHSDGKGFDIVLECFPVNGRVTLRRDEPKAEQAEQPEQA